MAEKSSFFNAELVGDSWDRTYTAEDYADYFSSFIGNGVFPNPSSNLLVIANNNMSVTLSKGKAWINGYMYYNDDELKLTIDNADGVLKRIDRIVIRLDLVNREIKSYVKKGTASSSPMGTDLTRTSTVYELCIAEIQVNAGAISILQSNITDTRLNNNLCGIVTQTVNEIDTDDLYLQLQGYIKENGENLEQWTEEQKQFFLAWFESIKNILNEDVAGNLVNRMVALEESSQSINNRILSLEEKVGSGLTADNITMSNGLSVEEAINGAKSRLISLSNSIVDLL